MLSIVEQPLWQWPRYPRSVIALHRTLIRLGWLTILVFGSGPDAYGQSVQSEPWPDELVHEQFTHAYLRGRDAAAATTLLKEDPFSVNAVALLVRAERAYEAIALVERISQARPDLFGSAFDELQLLGALYAPWDPRSGALTARVNTLREERRRAPTSSATQPGRSGNTVVASQAQDDGEWERALLKAQQQLEVAAESLRNRTEWSVRDVATAMTPGLRLLRDLAERDRGPHGRQALAFLANSEFEAGQLREASGHFTLLEQRYPDSEVAWAAAMRAAQLGQSLGEPEAAAKSFARLGAVYAAKPTVPALASFYEARAYEAMARWTDALRAYRTAFNAWPANDADWIGLDWKVLYFTDPFVDSLWPRSIYRSDVAQRIEVLTRVVAVPSASEIERATWLLDHNRPSEAHDVLRRTAKTPQGPLATLTLRSLLHRAEVAKAVSAISRTGQLPRQAVRALERLCNEPFDDWVGIGCAIHASVLAVDGKADAADIELRRTFRAWVDAQGGAMKPSIPENEIARDARAIRDLLFQPDGVDGSRGQSKAYTPPPYIFMPSALRVTTDQGTQSDAIEAHTPEGRSNVILLSVVEARTLWETVEQLAACDRGRRTQRLDQSWHAMVGFSKLYCTVGGSWYTAPNVGPIHFLNLERTRAHAVVTDSPGGGGGGHVAVIEKVNGEWKVTGSGGSWVD